MIYKLRILRDIDIESYKEFSNSLTKIENEHEGLPITLELNSEGGDIYTALAFAARIRLSPLKINITVYGFVASAAIIILASGERREMAKEAWVMVHDSSDKLKGSLTDLERESKHLRRLEDQWVGLMEELTGTPASMWSELQAKTTYLNAEECLKLGLVDKII